jgi:hypothetical protein
MVELGIRIEKNYRPLAGKALNGLSKISLHKNYIFNFLHLSIFTPHYTMVFS